MKRKLKITLNGFHGYTTKEALVEIDKNPNFSGDKGINFYNGESEYIGEISQHDADKFTCGIPECCCGEGISTTLQIDKKDLKFKSVEICGNYAQN